MQNISYTQLGVAQALAFASTVTPNSNGGYDLITLGAMTGPLTLANPSGTPADWQVMKIRLRASGADRVVTLGSAYAFPTSSIGTSPFTVTNGTGACLGITWDSTSSKWIVNFENGLP